MPQVCYPGFIHLDGSRKYDPFILITSDFLFGINMVNFSV